MKLFFFSSGCLVELVFPSSFNFYWGREMLLLIWFWHTHKCIRGIRLHSESADEVENEQNKVNEKKVKIKSYTRHKKTQGLLLSLLKGLHITCALRCGNVKYKKFPFITIFFKLKMTYFFSLLNVGKLVINTSRFFLIYISTTFCKKRLHLSTGKEKIWLLEILSEKKR